ncbi:alpha-ketoglutarate-dependent dioxygenase AlkB family protein [Arenibacter certesii]|uniref:Alkylated DNA repair protein n=1 Tax=Arenibacter certesii TaxID=228955 RepID=A0A918J3D2_9FLAO|nr:alpha-ketoglutarate-dependent dioxygenase AlkB [Arenibacter certesii]GGW45035.1 alkylated DNA repair protein [Arenibacter certesii]
MSTPLFLGPIDLQLPNSDIIYYPNFISSSQATICFDYLKNNTPWQQDTITLFGKTYLQPRLTALYGDNGKTYKYSGITMQPHSFSKELLEIRNLLLKRTEVAFTSCLINLYRDGSDSNGWHADDEKELGINPIIASITLGQERYFHLKHKEHNDLKHKILLQHGSLLVMKGETQHHWLHQIPKTKRRIEERINLTFRVIK